MEIEEKLKKEHIKILNNIKNPTITKVIKLSEELNVDVTILAKYFIDKASHEMEY